MQTDNQHTYPQTSPWISWGAVIGGVLTATAVQVALSELCLGLGLSLYDPFDPDSKASQIATGTLIAVLAFGLISIFTGGWVAGRMKRHGTRIEAAVHGGLVWALTSLGAMFLATLSIGVLAGGTFSFVGQVISAGGQAVSSVAPAVTAAAVPSWDSVRGDITAAFQRMDAAGGTSEERFTERSRLMQLMGKSFTVDGPGIAPTEREELTRLASSQLGIPVAAAARAIDQWQGAWRETVAAYLNTKDLAKREAADAALALKRRAAQGAIIAFGGLLIGLIAAMVGSLLGSACVWTLAGRQSPVSRAMPA